MNCINPITVRKNGTVYHNSCEKCENCLAKKRRDWSWRISQENKRAFSGHFLTLTYNDEHLPIINIETGEYREGVHNIPEEEMDKCYPILNKKHLQDFIRAVNQRNGQRIIYYAVGEYGGQFKRPHYHIIALNLDLEGKFPRGSKLLKYWVKSDSNRS